MTIVLLKNYGLTVLSGAIVSVGVAVGGAIVGVG
jgi:hypothetical protein